MSQYIESEPESDDSLGASVSSENEEDRAFVDDAVGEGSPDRSIYRHVSEEEEGTDDEKKALREVRRMTSRLLHRHGKREKLELKAERYHCGFGVRRKRTEGEIQEGLMDIIESHGDAGPVLPKKVKPKRRFDAPMAVNVGAGVGSREKGPEDAPRPVQPRKFQFIEEMKERDRTKRIRDNTSSLKKVLDKERTQVHRRLTAPKRKVVVKKNVAEPPKGMRDISSFFANNKPH